MIGDPMNPMPPTEGRDLLPGGASRSESKVSVVPAEQQDPRDAGLNQPDWLGLARQAYQSSETWLQANVRATWMRTIAAYRNQHPAGSPFYSEAYKHRSKHFRPLTRGLVRSIQAAMAQAFFSSADILSIDPEDADNPLQAEAAKLMKHLVQYRLDKTIPWYRIVLGAGADAAVLGTVVSHQGWEYETRTLSERIDPETGATVRELEILKDRPRIRLVPAENFRISPAADWLDPVNSSPYLIELIPMFLGDVLAKIKEQRDNPAPKIGEPRWEDIGEARLLAAGSQTQFDPVRQAREGHGRVDPKTVNQESVNKFRPIWLHRNIVRWDGRDWLYYTAGTAALLSEPVPLDEVLPWNEGQRDYVAGVMEVETDRPWPAGPAELIQGLQSFGNEIRNQRIDNVRQVLNKRFLTRMDSGLDTRALARNVPGAVIPTRDPNNDVRELVTGDVTSSSYQEEDRLQLDLDDLSGRMSAATVQSNRKLGETVGGLELMGQGGNQIREMELRTFVETWYEPTLRQLCRLLAWFETDQEILTISAKRAGLGQILPEFFDQQFPLKVNVGMGATNPAQRLNRFVLAMSTAVQLVPGAQARINEEEVVKEVMATAGYEDGARFFDFDKPAPPPSDPKADAIREQTQARAEIEHRKLDLQEKRNAADIDLLAAETTAKNIDAMYSATQAAGIVALNQAAARAADALLKSGGFKDHDAPPIVPLPLPAEAAQALAEPHNTHPEFPPRPAPADAGMLAGHETVAPEDGAAGSLP